MGDDGGPGAGADTRLFWMEERISNALRLKPEKLKALQASADARCVRSPTRRPGAFGGASVFAGAGTAAPAGRARCGAASHRVFRTCSRPVLPPASPCSFAFAVICRDCMLEFLDKPHETRCVIIDGKGLEAVKELPSTLKKNSKSVFFLKLMNEKITPENIDSLVGRPAHA
jgi:hypothetical protein